MTKRCFTVVMLTVAAVTALTTGCMQVTRSGFVVQRTIDRGLVLDRNMTQTPEEQMHSLAAVIDTDAKGLVADSDLFWQCDRPTRLTRWHER